MAFPRTPQTFSQTDVTPSVLMTPSSSCGRPLSTMFGPPRAMITPLPFSLPPTPPPARPEEHTDVLGGLYERGCPEIVDDILSLLDKDDIVRCAHVSHSWYDFVTTFLSRQNSPPERPVSITSDENNNAVQSELKPLRQPLKMIINTGNKETSTSCPLPLKRARITMTPCPQCPSPAKVLSNRRAECTICSFDFCRKCFNPWHNDEQDSCGIKNFSTSPKKNNILTACPKNKKSKKNLRRL